MIQKNLLLFMTALWALTILQPVHATDAPKANSGQGFATVPIIFDILVDRSDSDALLLATREGFYSMAKDGSVRRISKAQVNLWELAPHPSNPDIIYAAGITANGGQSEVLVSTDGGGVWRSLEGSEELAEPIHGIALDQADPSRIYAFGAHIFLSEDNGKNWRKTGSAPPMAIKFAASSQVRGRFFAATGSGLLITSDGGQTWDSITGVECRQPSMDVSTTETATVYVFNLCDGLLRGDEQSGGWNEVSSLLKGCIITRVAVSPSDASRIFLLARCNAILESVDGGHSWRKFGSPTEKWTQCAQNSEGLAEYDTLSRRRPRP